MTTDHLTTTTEKAKSYLPFLRHFTEIEMSQLMAHAETHYLEPQEVVLQEGKTVDHLYIIKQGKCAVTMQMEGTDIFIANLRDNDVFGEMSLFGTEPATATVRTVSAVDLWSINRKNLRLLLTQNDRLSSKFYSSIVKVLSERLHLTDINSALYEYLLSTIKKRNEDVISLNSQLKEASTIKDRFLQMVAHDIRHPIASIFGHVENLDCGLLGNLNETQRNTLSKVKRLCRSILPLLDDLLDVAMIESGNFPLQMAPHSIQKIVREAMDDSQVTSKDKNISFSLEDKTQEEIFVTADRNKLVSVLNNLYSNGIKYSPANSQIHTIINRSNGTVTISVKDFGVGIPANEMNRLFKPFSKTSAKVIGSATSSGLGLYIVKKIVEAHGGTIDVSSTPNHGSTFSVTLNIRAMETQE